MNTPTQLFANSKMAQLAISLCFLLLLITNKWASFEEGATLLGQTDTLSFRTIAKAYPSFPSENIPFHHAQRFAIPFVLGGVSYVLQIELESVFKIFSIVICGFIILLVHNIFTHLRLTAPLYTLMMAMIIFNPYVFRYYLTVPFMAATDLVFVSGSCLMIFGLLKGKLWYLALGSAIAVMGRQTVVMLLPAVALWLNVGDVWRERSSYARWFSGILVVTIIVGYYLLSAAGVTGFSYMQNDILLYVAGIFFFFQGFSLARLEVLVEFLLRGLTSSVVALSVLAMVYMAKRERTVKNVPFGLLLLMVLCIWVQPFLAGPDITGNGIVRLFAHAYIPLVVALSVFLNDHHALSGMQANRLMFLVLLLFIGSLHHRWTLFGGLFVSPEFFALFQYSMALLVGGAILKFDSSRTHQVST